MSFPYGDNNVDLRRAGLIRSYLVGLRGCEVTLHTTSDMLRTSRLSPVQHTPCRCLIPEARFCPMGEKISMLSVLGALYTADPLSQFQHVPAYANQHPSDVSISLLLTK